MILSIDRVEPSGNNFFRMLEWLLEKTGEKAGICMYVKFRYALNFIYYQIRTALYWLIVRSRKERLHNTGKSYPIQELSLSYY